MANEPIQLSPKVLDLVSADRHARRPVGRLSERHLRELTAIAERRGELQDVALSHKALQAIAVGAPARVSTPLLGRVLSDAHAPRSDRVTAARLLATMGGSPARQLLRCRRGRQSAGAPGGLRSVG
jgi:hypothetical protein